MHRCSLEKMLMKLCDETKRIEHCCATIQTAAMIVYETLRFDLCMLDELRHHVRFKWVQLPEDMIKQYDFGKDNVGWEAEEMRGFQCYQCDLEPDATAEDERGRVHRIGHFRVGDWLLCWNKKEKALGQWRRGLDQ